MKTQKMSNAQTTARFFAVTDADNVAMVLKNIARHSGITEREALDVVTTEGAGRLIDYMIGPDRCAAGILMKNHCLA